MWSQEIKQVKSPPPLNFNAGCRDIMVATSCFASACMFACQILT